MKTTIKKIIPLLVLAGTLAGCSMYGSKPGPVEDLVGLYELEMIKKKHNVDDKDTYDYMSEIGAKAYFTINKDGYGYYGYKDKNSKARVDQVFSIFGYNGDDETYEEDHPEYVKSIVLTDGLKDIAKKDSEVGCLSEPVLGFHDTITKKFLEYTIPYYKGSINKKYIQYYQYVQYKKIGDDTSLKKINSLMGTSAKFVRPYEMKAMTRFMVYSCNHNSQFDEDVNPYGYYDYAFLDVDSYKNGYIKFYYREAGESVDQVVNARVTVKEKGHSVNVHVLDKDFVNESAGKLLTKNLPVQYTYDLNNDHYIDESFGIYQGTASTPAELIAELTTTV